MRLRPTARGSNLVADQHARQPIADIPRREIARERQRARTEYGMGEPVAGRTAHDATSKRHAL